MVDDIDELHELVATAPVPAERNFSRIKKAGQVKRVELKVGSPITEGEPHAAISDHERHQGEGGPAVGEAEAGQSDKAAPNQSIPANEAEEDATDRVAGDEVRERVVQQSSKSTYSPPSAEAGVSHPRYRPGSDEASFADAGEWRLLG
jgi:hypothetical protein